MIGLYVHIPYCRGQKCPYCDFYSVPYQLWAASDYIAAVRRNIEFYNERYDTVYFGGGTPSLLSDEISSLLGVIRYADDAEVTIEANPRSLDIDNLKLLHACGVNRISIGVQSFMDTELSALGRKHDSEDAVTAINLAKDAGFDNISIDLMLGIPRQSIGSVKRTMSVLEKLPVTHVSAYMLKIEEGTEFHTQNVKVNDDYSAELYLEAARGLDRLGYTQYEISNFSKPGFECRHNLKYWRSEEYLGIGSGAHSYYKGERFEVMKDSEAFTKSPVQQTRITDKHPTSFADFAMLKLRLSEGLAFAEAARFGVSEAMLRERTRTVPFNYLKMNASGLSLTREGFLVSNEIITKIIG
ncbi:MAG: radical SAM family heme chaperone HemW [Oscillospiraceae bacterium]|jgi:oxygen-independent coproporphyrinogen-3 oxidase|nr:radical SAM family heme chaperone HemW [Oscillospiraceae bacterium]